MRYEVLTAVKMSMLVLWVLTPCRVVPAFQRNTLCVRFEVLTAVRMTMLFFRVVTTCRVVGTYRLHLQAEDGDSMFLRNVGMYLRIYTELQPRRKTFSQSPSSALKMEIVCFSETLVSTYKSTWYHNPEGQH
jgi:hypothetical protein